MASQGLVSLVKDGKTILKVVAGSDGFNGEKLLPLLHENMTVKDVFKAVKKCGFGENGCVIVQTPDRDYDVDGVAEDLTPEYRNKFHDPKFNPRWSIGTVEYLYVKYISTQSAIEFAKVSFTNEQIQKAFLRWKNVVGN